MPNDEIPTDTEAAEALDTPQEATPHASHDPGLTLVTDPPVEAAAPAEDFKRKYDATHGRLMTTVRRRQDYQKEVNASYAQINTEMDLLRQENEKLRAEAEAHRPPEPPPAELVDELGERAAAAMWNAMLKRQGKPSAQQSATPDPQSARAPANPSSARFAAPRPRRSMNAPSAYRLTWIMRTPTGRTSSLALTSSSGVLTRSIPTRPRRSRKNLTVPIQLMTRLALRTS